MVPHSARNGLNSIPMYYRESFATGQLCLSRVQRQPRARHGLIEIFHDVQTPLDRGKAVVHRGKSAIHRGLNRGKPAIDGGKAPVIEYQSRDRDSPELLALIRAIQTLLSMP